VVQSRARRYALGVRVRLLGPIEIDADDGCLVVLNAAKERSLIAAFALAGGATVSTDSLISSLWGEEPPTAARKTLQTYVWNLRRALGAERIVTGPVGYSLRISHDEVDVHRFRALVRAGDDALSAGRVDRAREMLGAAVALWTGEPLSGVGGHTGLAAEATRLEQEYLGAVETRIAADLAGGCHDGLVGELEALVREHPFRERLWGHLMVALYRSGRQADALAAYQRVREVLRDELGLEPGGELRRIESAVLRHEVASPTPAARAIGIPDTSIRATPVRYARASDGVTVAYQSAGGGAIDILALPGYIHHLDIWWNAPTDRLVRTLAGMGRLTVFDKRGMGLSDRPELVDVNAWTLDALGVLDAIGAERAVLLGVSGGAPTALQLAALHPDRVSAVVLFGGYARHLAALDYPIGHDPAVIDAYAQNLEAKWGTGVALSSAAPSLARDPNVRAYWARYQRLSASPSAAIRFFRAVTEADVRHLLREIEVPTLVAHAERDVLVPVAQGRYVADHIPGAEFVAFDSDIHLICVSDVLDQLADAVTAFLDRAGVTGRSSAVRELAAVSVAQA
jgi:DNA-binding SARP family transcriptional activator/pimeloyl-ACP methyl ester carboxylesterase